MSGNVGINIQYSISIIATVFIILAVALLGFSIYRIIKFKKTRKILYGITCFFLVVFIVFNYTVQSYAVLINMFVAGKKITMDATEVKTSKKAAAELTETIESEGIVLLENKGNTLPLAQGNINVFGYASHVPVYGGSGSGGGDESKNINVQKGLENAGFTVNEELVKFYEDRYVPRDKIDIFNLVGGDFNIHEPAVSEYSPELMESIKSFSDTALVMISRNSGEGADLATDMKNFIGGTEGDHYLTLSQSEEEMLNMVSENFEKVIVLINSSYAMELGFLEDPRVDAALWIGGPGSTGFNAVANVLGGKVNPSGKLVDTYAYDATSAPSFYNVGEFPYSNSNFTYGKDEWHYKYINYIESIYVGYKFYETRFIDNNTGLMDEAAYKNAVQYPFGYGLSYTDFKQEIIDFKSDNDTITMDVKVTNTGNVAGKSVVQAYYTPPYTVGGIEKAHVNLAGFGKTQLLSPNESQAITISFSVEDMVSYDDKNVKAYILEKGEYDIKLMANSHDIIDSRKVSIPETIVYDQDNKRTTDQIAATNQFDNMRGDDLVYVSRADWEGTLPTEVAQPIEASPELLAELSDMSVNVEGNDTPIVRKNHNIPLYEMKDVPYGDPKWGQFLEQLSPRDMATLITKGGFQTVALHSIKKPATIDSDGPAGINHLVSGNKGNQYTSEVVTASTWNTDLGMEMGATFAKEAKAYKITGLYAPAVNLHRSPFSGRNFEYYSEDSLLSGKIGAAVVKGMKENGTYPYVKHFAMYDQETMRYTHPTGAAVWSNEQAMREIYLKPFEMLVKEGGANGIMSSYNRMGSRWAGESKELLQTVLRDEWGFEGTVISDYFKPQYMNISAGVMAGNDMVLYVMPTKLNKEITNTNAGQQYMRKASHNILYSVANSHAYDVVITEYPSWMYLLIGINTVLLAILMLCMIKFTNSVRKVKTKKSKK